MPSNDPPPVLQDWAGWSPYQQQTSVARVIESPIEAMLVGSGGAADAFEARAAAAATRQRRNARRAIGLPAPQRRDLSAQPAGVGGCVAAASRSARSRSTRASISFAGQSSVRAPSAEQTAESRAFGSTGRRRRKAWTSRPSAAA